ncbi:hypothetical protein Y032_0074g872 [Ancylostoma ceylanicum]|uniref:Uncharacterized protein n=1 Tax=Ancylostoma ceylanicum TaxID=53326 RepID=A0A016TVF7_9BILA|nr:hypothetical protein Y032_0074g872 [Ancylostoma ceylanicum]
MRGTDTEEEKKKMRAFVILASLTLWRFFSAAGVLSGDHNSSIPHDSYRLASKIGIVCCGRPYCLKYFVNVSAHCYTVVVILFLGSHSVTRRHHYVEVNDQPSDASCAACTEADLSIATSLVTRYFEGPDAIANADSSSVDISPVLGAWFHSVCDCLVSRPSSCDYMMKLMLMHRSNPSVTIRSAGA